MIEWKEFALEEVVEKFIDYRGKTPKKTASGVPLITAKIVKNGRINTPNEFIALEDYDKWMTRGIPQKGDVVMTTEAPLGEVAQLCFDGKVALAQRIITMRGKVNVLDNGFLKYMLQSPLMQHRIHSRSSGTTVIGIKSSELKKIPIPVPPIDIQKKIASILGSIDEKIELNLKMNETLEEMAMTLYKHWFVDFGPFQDEEFVESELGMIPKGWKVIQVKDLGEVITGKTPSTKVKEYYGDKIPFIKIPDMHGNVYIVKTETMLSELGAQSQKNKMLPPNTVCVSCIATPGLVVLTSEMSQTNQQINSVVCKEGVSPYFVYLFFKSISDNIVTLGSGGTATLNLNKGDFSRIKLLMPTNEVMTGFNNKVESIFNLIKINSLNNIELENLRDYLLPRLLSGEIDVSQAEKQVEEVL
ncbi:restriction endonuclease subunit S [Ureibacillus sp. FSL K6-8385]|uniref:restriction endonuclease subunit S n=1 Tax=Ureibacillus sp. FSL K6-8385 TaxID=2954684 RepID=UPI0031594875